MKKIKMKVNGMHCNGCASKIKNGLASINPNIKTEINLENGQVDVEFNKDDTNVNSIKSKIAEVGFQVESVELE